MSLLKNMVVMQEEKELCSEAITKVNQLLAEGRIAHFIPPFSVSGNWVNDSKGRGVCEMGESREALKDIAAALNLFVKVKEGVVESADVEKFNVDDFIAKLKGEKDWVNIRIALLDAALNLVGRGKRKIYEPDVAHVKTWKDAKDFLSTVVRDAERASKPFGDSPAEKLSIRKEGVAKDKDIEVTHNGENIGTIWRNGREVQGEHTKSGMSWSGGTPASMAQLLKNHHDAWVKDQARKKQQGVAEAITQGNYDVGLEDIGKPVLVDGKKGYVLLHIERHGGSGELVAKVIQPKTGSRGYYDLNSISRVKQGVKEGLKDATVTNPLKRAIDIATSLGYSVKESPNGKIVTFHSVPAQLTMKAKLDNSSGKAMISWEAGGAYDTIPANEFPKFFKGLHQAHMHDIKKDKKGVAEGYWKDAVQKAEADREARKGKPFEKNPASHDDQDVYAGDKDLAGFPVSSNRKQGAAEGSEEAPAPTMNTCKKCGKKWKWEHYCKGTPDKNKGEAGEIKGELDSRGRFTKDTVQTMFGKLSPDAKDMSEGYSGPKASPEATEAWELGKKHSMESNGSCPYPADSKLGKKYWEGFAEGTATKKRLKDQGKPMPAQPNPKGVSTEPVENVKEGSDWSPGAKETIKQDNLRSLKNLIALYTEKGNTSRVKELEAELKSLHGMTEMDNRTPSGDRREQRANSPEAIAQREKELQAELRKVSPEMRKKLRLPEPKQDVAESPSSKLSSPFEGGRKTASITSKHKPLVWENMLGTVMAKDPASKAEPKYFDYNWDDARAYAKVDQCDDLRICKSSGLYQGWPEKGKMALWGIPRQGVAEGENIGGKRYDKISDLKSRTVDQLNKLIQKLEGIVERYPDHTQIREYLGLAKMIRAEKIGKKGVAEGSLNEDEYDKYENGLMTQEDAVAAMFARLAKQGRDPLDMIAHRFGWSTHELDDLAQQHGFKNSAEWLKSIKQGVAEGVTAQDKNISVGDYVQTAAGVEGVVKQISPDGKKLTIWNRKRQADHRVDITKAEKIPGIARRKMTEQVVVEGSSQPELDSNTPSEVYTLSLVSTEREEHEYEFGYPDEADDIIKKYEIYDLQKNKVGIITHKYPDDKWYARFSNRFETVLKDKRGNMKEVPLKYSGSIFSSGPDKDIVERIKTADEYLNRYLVNTQWYKKNILDVNPGQGVAEGSALECPSYHSHDVKTYSDGEKECNDCHKTWEVKGMKESLLQSLVSLVNQSTISEMAASRTAEDLEVGDVVEIAGNVEHQGMTGEIIRFGEGKRFVVVNLYNGGLHSFHSSDVIEADLSHEDEDEDDEENVFWVVFHDEDEEHTWIGKVSREQGTKWREFPHKGKPDYRWGASYMGYLEPHQVMDWIHKDYSRGMQIEGPFFSAEEAEEHARQHFGEINEEKEVCKQCGMEDCTCKPGECNCTPKPGYPKK